MSMDPYFYWHQNSNNIEIVPSSVSENANNAGNIYLPACEQQVPANCVLPGFHENNVVINYGNVHFSGCIDTPNYICNPYTPEVTNTPHGIHSYSNYNYHNNLVDLTGLNYQNPTYSYTTCMRSLEHDLTLFDYDYTENRNKETYSYEKDYKFEANLPPVSKYSPYYDNCVKPELTMPVDIMSTKSRMMKKYTKYDDLRDILEERHTNTRVESNSLSNNKPKEDSRDLKHLLRQSRTEKMENITNTEDKRDRSIHRELVKNNIKLKRTIQDIQKAKNSLSKLKNSSNILERKYAQKRIECNPGLLERKTLSKAQKSNLSPDALKRYLAYQRFLRNCCKSPSPSPQKILEVNKTKASKDKYSSQVKDDSKDKYSSQVKDKAPRRLKREDKSEIVKSTNSTKEIKAKEKSNRKVNSHVNQKDKKEHSKSKLTTYSSLKAKKEESKGKVADSVDKKLKKDISKVKETLDIEEKRKRDEINEKLAKYLEKKRKRQEIKERLFGCDDRKKEKTESEAKLLQYLKQNRKQTTKPNDDDKTSSSCDSLNKREDDIDLRTVLTRKRTKNLSQKESKRIKTTKSQQENVIITVKQDVNNKSEPAKVTHTTSKVKTIKTKRIKLVINIVCPSSASSDDSDQTTKDPCTSPHQDLSFLDDFNVDEIVDSLDVSSTQTPVNDNINAEDIHNTNVNEKENECNIAPMEHLFNNPLLYDNSLTQEDESNMAPIPETGNNNEEQQIEDCHNPQNDYTPSCEKNKDEQVINIRDETEINADTPNINMVSEHREKDKGEHIINISHETLIDATTSDANIVPRRCEKENDKRITNNSDEKARDTISSVINVDTGYCDDVYEVIDISEDAHINTNVITDIIDLDSNDHHDNISFMIKSSENFEKTKTISQKPDKVIQNLEKSDVLKNNTDTSSIIVTTINLVTQGMAAIPFIDEIENTNCENINIPTQQKNQQNNTNIEKINTVITTEKEPVLFEANDLNIHNIETDMSNKHKDKQNIDPLKGTNLAIQENKTDMKSNILTKSDTDKDSVSIVKSDKTLPKISCCQITVENNQDNVDEHKYIKTKSENTSIKQSQVILEKSDTSSEINNVNMIETKSDKITNKPDEPVNDTTVMNSANTIITKPSNDANKEDRIRKPTNNIQADKTLSKPVQNQITSVAKSILNVANNIVADSKVVKNKQTVKDGQANGIITPKVRNYVRAIEKRMSEYLNTKFSITEIVHRGYFSNIYKCRDPLGKTYALKVVQLKYRSMAIYRDKILMDLQKSTTEDNYVGILRMLESFNSSGEWCFLSEFYPKNLKQALLESGKCFHIDRVQILARQLVAAVTMLTNNQIIHADIKPSHILLNSTHDRLKLCSFDRSDYNYNIRIIPSSGTASYRAPEMILGYDADYRIDVWSTALVMYEMATNIKLFPGRFNNDILYKQLCTLGPLNYDMLENCTLRNMHFLGSKFMRQLDNQKWVFVQFSGINNKLRHKLFTSYNRDWRPSRTQWQITEDLDKIEMLYKLLKQMLTMDPRHRLPITYVQANEFIYDYISDREIQ